MYQWTGEGTPFTIEFNRFFETDERSVEFQKIAYSGRFASLFPDEIDIFAQHRTNDEQESFFAALHRAKFQAGMSDEEFRRLYRAGEIELMRGQESEVLNSYYHIIKNEVKANYYYRQISAETPEKFLHKFHARIRQRANVWALLLHSMSFLRDDMAVNNYDLYETATYANEVTRNSKNTVDGKDTGNTSSDGSSTSKSSGTSTGTSSATTSGDASNVSFNSDTPENSVADITEYMSSAARSESTNSGKQDGTQDSKSTGESESKESGKTTTETGIERLMTADGGEQGSGANTLRRFGNIGVMTSAQVLEGWRAGVYYDAFKVIFNDLENLFLGVF